MPITLKDCHATAGIRSTWGDHPSLADHVPSEDSVVAARLKAAGAVLFGKTNGPEVWGAGGVFEPQTTPGTLLAYREAPAPASPSPAQ